MLGTIDTAIERTADAWRYRMTFTPDPRACYMFPPARRCAILRNVRSEIPTPFIDTEAPQPDTPELAALYEAKALEMEHQATDGARSPAQQVGLRAGASSFRRKAAEIRRRLEGKL